MAEPLNKLRFVIAHETIRIRALKRFANQRELKCLGSLRVVDSPAVERALNAAGFDLFDRIGCGKRHQSRSGTRRTFNNGADFVRFDEGTHGIVNHYDARGFLLDDLEPAIYGVLPLGSAADHARYLGNVVSGYQPEHIGSQVRLRGQDDLIDRVALLEASKRVHQHRHAAQLEHLLGAVRVHARADAGSGDDRCIELSFGHCAAELCRGALGRPSSLKRPKIILPAVVCKTLVTDTSTFLPIIRRALSTTTIVPSSR